MEFSHIPVLLQPCLDGLAIDPAGIYLDGTAGGAGHSREIAKRLTTGQLIALDQTRMRWQPPPKGSRAYLPAWCRPIFAKLPPCWMRWASPPSTAPCWIWASPATSLTRPAVGFPTMQDAPLDMRMSQQGPTAADLVNTLPREELARVLREYGEEPYAWQIAGKIVRARAEAPIENHDAAGRACRRGSSAG